MAPKLTALLGWFDEEPALLKQCVESLNGTVDRLVAVDGAYRLFPQGTPSSPPEQAEAIRGAAVMPVDIHIPETVWDDQLAKRKFMFEVGEQVTSDDDFFLIIDADETLDPGFPKHELEQVDLVGWMPFDDAGGPQHGGVRRLMRAKRGITLGPAHGDYRLPDGTWLQCTDDKAAQVEAHEFAVGMTHHPDKRGEERFLRQSQFYVARVGSDLELQGCKWCGNPATKRVWTDWKFRGKDLHGEAVELCAVHAWKERNRSMNIAERLGVRKRLRSEGLL